MMFWGVEVKPGQTLTCNPGVNMYLHLSQASLGESKKDKGSTSVPVHVNVDDKKLVLGTLSHDKCAQIQYDLVFEKEFKLSHGWKDGSVFFVGYKALIAEDMSDGYSDSESEEEPHPIQKANGKPAAKEESRPAPSKASLQKQLKAAEEAVKAKVDESDDEDESDDDSDDESGDEDESDEEMDDESDDEDGSSEEEEKVTPKKPESGKKRKVDSDSKASVSGKKAKLVTPAKTEGKKGGGVHVPTPYPSKQSTKKPQANEGKKQQIPRSGGAFGGKSRSKPFGS